MTIGHPHIGPQTPIDRSKLKEELNELDRQLAHLLLFSDEPKFLNKDQAHQQVYDKFPLAYYDPTQEETMRRITELKNKILLIKHELGMREEVHYDVVVQNSTFPIGADDILDHIQDSYVNYSNENETRLHNNTVINGNYTRINEVYLARKAHSFGHKNILDASISLINGKLGKFNKKSEDNHNSEHISSLSSSNSDTDENVKHEHINSSIPEQSEHKEMTNKWSLQNNKEVPSINSHISNTRSNLKREPIKVNSPVINKTNTNILSKNIYIL